MITTLDCAGIDATGRQHGAAGQCHESAMESGRQIELAARALADRAVAFEPLHAAHRRAVLIGASGDDNVVVDQPQHHRIAATSS